VTPSSLTVRLGDSPIGIVQRAGQRLSFEYHPAWQRTEGAMPLSLSMPLAQTKHPHRAVDAFLWGLLPDNEIILDRWARRFQVSARSAYALLAHVGGDCAGAVRIVPSGDDVQSEASVEWLDDAGIASRLRALRSDVSAWRGVEDGGQFSLGGAQPKTALLFDGKRWGIPSGALATTHILKPGIADLDGHAENEHLCLELARALGLPTASSSVRRFEDQVAIVVERYDRIASGGGAGAARGRAPLAVTRVHQEDACQALAVLPGRKYESDGGPGARAIVELLRASSSRAREDVETFVAALAFAWLVGGTDAHAKNYSVLLGAGGRARLAPLYDIASVLPYATGRERKLKLAMKIGGKYRLHEIGPEQWRALAVELSLDPGAVRDSVQTMAAALPDHAADVARRAREAGASRGTLGRLVATLTTRAKQCARAMG